MRWGDWAEVWFTVNKTSAAANLGPISSLTKENCGAWKKSLERLLGLLKRHFTSAMPADTVSNG